MKMGGGKTATCLEAFCRLQAAGEAERMLVVAPKRVADQVWPYEPYEWANFAHLRTVRIDAKHKEKAVWADADIYVINYELLAWLKKYMRQSGLDWKWDVLVLDEVRKIKEPGGEWHKLAYLFGTLAIRRWGLTGTPASRSLLDLYGQVKVVCRPNPLGKTFTAFRDEYFIPDYSGYAWKPRDGAEAKIREQLKDAAMFIDVSAIGIEHVVHKVHLSDKARVAYDKLVETMVAEVAGQKITAVNAAALYTKLKQASGASAYVGEGESRAVVRLHEDKLDALERVLDEIGDEQVFILYGYRHEIDAIRERLGKDVPVLGAGVSEREAARIIDEWNSGKLKYLLASPQSVGHGMNLQKSSAHHIVWFSPTGDLELWDQANARLARQGNKSETVFVHTLVAENTVDILDAKRIKDKDATQEAFLNGLAQILRADLRGEKSNMPIPMNAPPKAPGAQVYGAQAAAQQPPVAPAAPTGLEQFTPEQIAAFLAAQGRAAPAAPTEMTLAEAMRGPAPQPTTAELIRPQPPQAPAMTPPTYSAPSFEAAMAEVNAIPPTAPVQAPPVVAEVEKPKRGPGRPPKAPAAEPTHVVEADDAPDTPVVAGPNTRGAYITMTFNGTVEEVREAVRKLFG